MTTTIQTLQKALDTYKGEFLKKASDVMVKTFDEGVQDLADSGITEQARKVGDQAPDFTLPNAQKKEVNLYDYLKEGPVVLTWYRGGWCPYCNIQLRFLQSYLPKFKEQGANLIAISPETPDHSLSTQEKNELEFEVLSDTDNQTGREYGLVYKLQEAVLEQFKGRIDVAAHNGNDDNELPLAATYVIDPQGIIRYAYVDYDYRRRAEPEAILKVLKEIK